MIVLDKVDCTFLDSLLLLSSISWMFISLAINKSYCQLLCFQMLKCCCWACSLIEKLADGTVNPPSWSWIITPCDINSLSTFAAPCIKSFSFLTISSSLFKVWICWMLYSISLCFLKDSILSCLTWALDLLL